MRFILHLLEDARNCIPIKVVTKGYAHLMQKGTWYLGTCTQGSVQYASLKTYNHECCQDNFWDIKLSCRGVYRADWQITGYVGWSGGYIEIDGKR